MVYGIIEYMHEIPPTGQNEEELKRLEDEEIAGLLEINLKKSPAEGILLNPDSYLTEDQFDELNLRRKKLSNAVGIMTASGTIRHDLNNLD